MDFSEIVERKHTHSLKWNKYKGQDILPLWLADTEFKVAQPIQDALKNRVEHGILGYTHPSQYAPGNEAVQRWLKTQHNWDVKAEWIVWTPGVVPAFNVACKAYCQPGDKVIVQTPNYPPLLAAPKLNGLERVDVPTVEIDGRWTLDFAALEEAARDPACKLFIMCNPMNPVGSVLTDEEIARIAKICEVNNVIYCSDEIHCDLILDESASHIPAGKVDSLVERSVTLMAASKTFNVAGLGTSFAIIPDAKLRQQFNQSAMGIVPWATILGLVATEAAFTLCDDWHQSELAYLRQNRAFLYEQINSINGLNMLLPEATFLAWVDGSGLDVKSPQKWAEDKGVGPSPGADFGEKQFIRLNFGCPKTYLDEAVARLKR